MKKRKLKKKPIIILVLSILVLGIIFILIGNINNNKGDDKKVETKTDDKKEEIKVEEKPEKRISLAMVGDVLVHETVYLDADLGNGNYDFSHMFTNIEPMIKDYDLKYMNQESTIGGKNLGISAYPSFNSPDEIGDNLVDIGFNMVSLANNHSLDRGANALLYSNNYWKSKNVITAGAYSSQEERDTVTIYEKNGIKYAFLSYTTSSNAAIPNNYYINYYSDALAKQDIEKAADADVIIVAMHWGTEYTNSETQSQVRIAEYLSSLGVDLIIGTHPHVVEPITYIGDTLVIYSLGNFISNQLVLGVNQGTGMIVFVDIVLDEENNVKFENLDYELLLSYSDNSTNFKVIPYSMLTNNELLNYEDYKANYESVVERYMEI